MNQEDIEARIDEWEKKELEEAKRVEREAASNESGQSEGWQPIDLYRNNRRKRMENTRKEYPRGSRALVKAITETVINGGNGSEGLAHAKKRAEGDSDILKAQGYKDRASIRLNQYMEDHFLPAVEVIIDYSSPDELLNCKEALKALDDMALGVGSMSGYTASYVRQAYGNVLGQTRGKADLNAIDEMRRIRALVASDQIRTAIGAAQKLKRKVDDGETSIEPEDYAVLGRIVAYAN